MVTEEARYIGGHEVRVVNVYPEEGTGTGGTPHTTMFCQGTEIARTDQAPAANYYVLFNELSTPTGDDIL